MVVYPEQITILILLPIKMVSLNSNPNQLLQKLQSNHTQLFIRWRLQGLLPIHTKTEHVLKQDTFKPFKVNYASLHLGFTPLFRENIGLPFALYILWRPQTRKMFQDHLFLMKAICYQLKQSVLCPSAKNALSIIYVC